MITMSSEDSQNVTLNVTLTGSKVGWPDLTFLRTTSLVISCIALVAGTIGNGLVIYVTGLKMKKTVNSVWFLNLAMADFLFTAFLILNIIQISYNFQWILGDFMCKFNNMVNALNMFTSIFILVAISVDRCLSTWLVVWAQNKRTTRMAQMICVGIWLASLVCSIPYIVHRETIVKKGKTYCYLKASTKTYGCLVVFRFVLGFLIPFIVIICSYVALALRAKRLQRVKRQRTLRIIISIILAFFTCWLPFHVFQLMDYTTRVVKVSPTLKSVINGGASLSVSLAVFNSCLNPILYIFMCDEFQKKVRQSVCLVLESAFAEDHMLLSSRSLASYLSRSQRKSDSQAPSEKQGNSLFTNPDQL